ncbi:MAG: hypothetical protein JSV65_10550 [Armatimonadota bacterium]|nr:MAG: hypothetical protein JSV65_10550 [Armatimonadota bacterium]
MRHEENPLDFPLSLGHLGDLSVYLAPDEDGEPQPIVLDAPARGFLGSLVPLAEAAIRADLRRMAQEAEAELEERAEKSASGESSDSAR